MGLYDIDTSLDWDVITQPLYDDAGQIIPGYKQIKNSETGSTLHVCKDSYTPISNHVLKELANTLGKQFDFRLDGFASFKGGKKVLAYLKNNQPVKLAGFPCKDYLIIGNSHDGSTAFFVGASNFLYRCENMFSSTTRQWRVNHRSGASNKLGDLVDVYDMYFNEKTQMYEQVDRMTSVPVNRETKLNFADEILKIEEPKYMSTRMENIRLELRGSIDQECAILGDNVFGLFNGVTHYTSHALNSRSAVLGNPFGHANTLNQRALAYCNQLVEERPKLYTTGNHF